MQRYPQLIEFLEYEPIYQYHISIFKRKMLTSLFGKKEFVRYFTNLKPDEKKYFKILSVEKIYPKFTSSRLLILESYLKKFNLIIRINENTLGYQYQALRPNVTGGWYSDRYEALIGLITKLPECKEQIKEIFRTKLLGEF